MKIAKKFWAQSKVVCECCHLSTRNMLHSSLTTVYEINSPSWVINNASYNDRFGVLNFGFQDNYNKAYHINILQLEKFTTLLET